MNERKNILRAHAARYENMQPTDAVKLIYQNESGGGKGKGFGAGRTGVYPISGRESGKHGTIPGEIGGFTGIDPGGCVFL